MSWHSAERLAPAAVGAFCEALWLGTLAGVVAGSRLGVWVGLAFVPVAGGVALERWPAGSRWRLLAGLALTIGLPAAVVAGSRPAKVDQALAEAFVAVAFTTLAVWLGGMIGRPAPPAALRRAVRCFLSVVVVLGVAAAGGQRPVGAPVLVAAAVIAGVAHVAAARATEAAGATGSSRRPLAAWMGGVAVAALLLVLAASLGALLLTGPLHGPLLWMLDGLRYLVTVAGYVVGWIGYAVLRAAAAIAALFDLRLPHRQLPRLRHFSGAARSPEAAQTGFTLLDLVLSLLLVLAALTAVIAVWLILRRRRRPAAEPSEERESLLTTGEAMARTAHRLRAAVARAVRRAPRPSTPADAVRHEYRKLESRLGRKGFARPAAASARLFLAGLGDDEGLRVFVETLAGRYERARYADAAVSWSDADAFRGEAESLLAALTAFGRPRPD